MDRLTALGDPELRRMLLFVRGAVRPVTAGDAADALGVPRTAARWRLEKLTRGGLVVSRFDRRSGRNGPGAGRPAKTYAAAPDLEVVEFPRRRYEALIALLVRALRVQGRATELTQVGIAFGRELARSTGLRRGRAAPAGLERLCRGLGALGFHASLDSVSDDGAVIVSAACPLRPLVVADWSARRIDEGMWRGLVEAVAREHPASALGCRTAGCLNGDGPCRIVITFGAPSSQRK